MAEHDDEPTPAKDDDYALGFDPEEDEPAETPAAPPAATTPLAPGDEPARATAPPPRIPLPSTAPPGAEERGPIAEALGYPLRGDGWLTILVGGGVGLLLDFVSFVPFGPLVAGILSLGVFGALFLHVVREAIDGRETAPAWPDLDGNGVAVTCCRMLALLAIAFGPGYLVVEFVDALPGLFLLLVGALYFPVAIMALVVHQRLRTAMPDMVVPAVVRCLPGYLITVAGLILIGVLLEGAQTAAGDLPLIGWFLSAAVATYTLILEGRLIGAAYRKHRDKLGWEGGGSD